MARGLGNAGAARCRTAWHHWRQAEISPQRHRTEAAVAPCSRSMPHAGVVPAPPVPALPSAGLACVPRLSGRRAAPDRASVVRAASYPFAAQSGPVRVASSPRRQSVEWRHEVQGVTGAVRSVRVSARPCVRSPWPPFWGTCPGRFQNREEKKTRRRSDHAANRIDRLSGGMGGKGGIFFFSLFAKIV